MKTRYGFVSNSSSSSFVIKKENLTDVQLDQIRNYGDEAYRLGNYDKIEKDNCGIFGWIDERWTIEETNDEIKGHTGMDNFDFETFLETIGVSGDVIEWAE